MLKLKNGLAQGLSLKDTDGSWACMQQRPQGCTAGGSMAAAHSDTPGEVQSCWLGTDVSIATAVQVV